MGCKWSVEYHTSNVEVEIEAFNQSVYALGCSGCTITVKGKCKSIILDQCKKVSLYFDAAMATCEVVNGQNIHVHCSQKVPSVAIDQTDGIVVHLPESSMDTSVVASKSSEMNISWMDADGELVEKPIPEQYVHTVKNGRVTAEVSDLYSS